MLVVITEVMKVIAVVTITVFGIALGRDGAVTREFTDINYTAGRGDDTGHESNDIDNSNCSLYCCW